MSNSQTVSPLQTLEMFKESHPDLNSIEKILNFTEENFITTYLDREPFNGDVRKARRTYREALRIQEQITLLWANIKDTIASPSIKEALFNNIPDSFLEFQNLIPAYNRIFGNLDFIECEHTRSIFGPAAYFVDLLRFIEKHIPQDQVEHPLAERQPRLFNLALDKENTFNLVPYIDLVNEVLEDFVRKGDSSPYQELEKAKFPIDLPFHLPLEEIRIYLKQLKIKLQDIYRLFSLVGDNAFANLKNTNIDEEKSKQIYQELQKNNILDFRGAITDAFQPDKAGYSLKLSNDFDQDDEKAVIKKLKEYKAIEPEIAREILALSPREYKLLAKEISDDQIFAYYGSKELFTISKTNFSAAIETALNNSSTNLVEVLDRPANNSFKEELKEKKFDLSGKVEVLVISPNEKWQLFIPEKNARYTIDKQDASLTFYREVSLKGKGSLEDVEKFIEQTKLTHKQLNELLYLDLSNDEINANLNSLFFINNTGDGKGSLRIEHDCENELFRTIASFYTELENREFSAELRTKFTENGIGTLSENVKVLVDVLLAKKSDKWLLKDIENNKEYILQKDSSDLIVFEGNVEKFKVENVAESVITGLNKSEFPALLKDKFAEHNIAISEKIKISKWQTEKWRIWDSDNDKTYIVRHDKNELIVSDEPYDCIQNLTPQKLDRIYRFLKLARKLDWSYADLDWALRSLQDTPTGERVLNFDGVNDYVAITDIPSAQNPFTPDLTLEAWVQPALAGNNPIFTAGSPDGGFTQFQFFITPLGKLAFFCNAQDARGDRNWESELKSSQINSGNSDSKIYFAQPKQGGELVAIDLQAIPGKAPNNEQHGLILLSDRSISLGTFSHVAVTIQEAYKIEASDTNTFSQLKFYINGTLDTTWTVLWKGNSPALDVTAIQSDITTIEINIGKDLLSEFFSGSITDVRLWKSVRTAEDIKDNRFKRLTGRDVNLISYWPMVTSSELQIQWPLSENPELQVYDLANSTPKLHGILGGSNLYLTPVWINGDLILEPFPAPISIYAYNFNGIDQYVGGTVTNLDSLEKFTFEAIVSIAEAGTHPVISLGKLENNQIELQHQLWIDPSNKLVLVTVTDGTNQFKFTSNNVITINQSTHITVVFNGTDAEFYIDGQQSTTTNETTTITPIDLEFADSTLLYLGRNFDNNPNTAYLKGTLQEVRIWNSERSTDQIEETRHYQLDGSEENLAGYWRLNEPNPQLANSSEAATRDRSFNGNHLFPGGIPKLYHPTDKPYDEVILPQPVAENAQNLHFWAQQYNIKIENKQRHGLGHSEQFTLQFWFKADEPIITDRKQLLFTQGDEDNGLSIYLNGGKVNLYAWAASLELAGTPQEYVRTIKSEILFSQALTDLDWHHLTFTYDETAELEIFSVNESYEKLNDREIQQGSVLESELKSQANLSDTYEVLVDIINQQWRIRDLLQRKTFLVRRSDERLTVYEKTPQDEIAFRFYLDGQAISEVTSTGYNNKDNGFRLDQVGDIYLGNLNTISFDELIFTRFDDGPATDDSYFKGQISDFRLWAIAIPQEYIETPAHEKHRRHISPVSEEHLLCYLPMTEGFGRSVSDHQGPLYSDIDLGQGAGYGPQILDQSPHRHHGKLSVGSDDVEQKWHTVTDLPVFRDRVLQLNGQDRYLLLPCAEELKLVKQSFTIEVWVKVAAFSPDMPIIGSISPSQQVPNQDFYLLLSDEGQIIAGFNDGDITTSEKLSLDTWHHIAWSFERETGLQKLYIDGKFQKIQDSGETCRGLEKDIPLYLGLRRQEPSNDGDPLIDKFFHGEIAELRIWQSTRTEEQIEKWWNVIPNEKDATPEAYWVFNRDPRSVLLDRTEHHRRAMVEIDPSGDIDQKWVQEHVPLRRQALTVQLNENPPEPIEYIDLANYQIGQQGTIEIWAKFERGQKQILFDGSTEDGNNTFCLEVVGQQLRFQVSISYEHTLCAQINLAEFPQEFESRFHHLVATWNLADSEKSGKIQLVCDTFYKASDQIAEVEISSQFTTLYFGLARSVKTINYPDDLTNAAPFFGEFSQIRIWDVVRSFTDVLRLQYADLAGDEANLQVYLPIDEGAQATLINLAASNGKEVTIKRIAIPDPNPEWQNVDWAVRLDGDDDFIRLSEENETYEITDEGTIEIWAKFSRDRNQVLFDASNDNSDNSRRQKFFILEVNKRKLRFGLEDQSGR
ncbi:MAG: Tc toxin subunit A, partial [Pleurocapsa sp. MO_192.B19]|nr:Tc toxin subunit A [Pleurocapsa sp. MO_192.B19]